MHHHYRSDVPVRHRGWYNKPIDYSHPPSQPNFFRPPGYACHPPDEIMSIKCGDVTFEDIGRTVQLSGTVKELRSGRFIEVRDETGTLQLLVPDYRSDLLRKMSKLSVRSYIQVTGVLRRRPSSNMHLPSKNMELQINEFIQVQTKRDWSSVDETLSKKIRISNAKTMTTDEVARCSNAAMRSYFTSRTAICDSLNNMSPRDEVTLCGWVLAKRQEMFIAFKDGYGEVQLVPSGKDYLTQFRTVSAGDVVWVKGVLAKRPFGQANARLANGSWEVAVTELTVVKENSPVCSTEDETLEVKTDCTDDGGDGDDGRPHGVEAADGGKSHVNKYTARSHTCGELRLSHQGLQVTLMGWVEFVRLTKFLLLRDGHGTTQIIVNQSDEDKVKTLENLSLESVVKVTGTVCARPPNQVNNNETGEIEVLAETIEVLNDVKTPLPFCIRDFKKARESLRLQHRYLDLRFKVMQKNLRLRSRVLMKMREFLIHESEFVEIETPTLFKKTPGGAREFVVPTHESGLFYSLVQSPQQLKQLLMVGAMDRYFQVARCYRDETTRADRQPEFTQLDLELSFCSEEDVMKLVEDLLEHSWEGPELVTPFPRLKYRNALETYGSDKPDLRIQWKLCDLTDGFSCTESSGGKVDLKEKIQLEDFAAFGFAIPKGMLVFSGTLKKSMEESMRESAPQTSAFVLSCETTDDDTLFGAARSDVIRQRVHITDDSVVVIACGPRQQVLECLGKARVSWADHMESKGYVVRTPDTHMLWVTDFPLFTSSSDGRIESCHHPFTAPKPDSSHMLFTDPLKVIGLHYDLVLNGCEIGGGSIRIHDGDLQQRVLSEILRLPTDSLEHLLQALRCGAPPHGGIALGVDRLIATMAKVPSIKDVIAFPKSLEGKDLMSGAPSPLTDEDRSYYHLGTPQTMDSK